MPDVVSLGEALFDLFAAPPGTTLGAARTFISEPGGAPANVAIGLARLGVDVGFVGRVGADSFGSRLQELLRQEGVDIAHFRAVAGSRTSIALVTASSPVDQDFVLFRGADTLLRPGHLDRSYLAGAQVFTYGSVTLSAGGRDAALQAARWARDDGVLVAFDANYRPAVWSGEAAARDAIMPALRCADVAKLNEVELQVLAGTGDLQAGCRRLLDLGVRLCLITAGAGGAWFDDGQASGHVPGFAADVVDTTGCGDAFLAAFLAGLVTEGRRLSELDEAALRRLVSAANAAGALNAARRGAIPGLPTRAAIDRLLAGRRPSAIRSGGRRRAGTAPATGA